MNDLSERIAKLSRGQRALFLSRVNKEKTPEAPASRILPHPRQGDLPLSFAQERLWFLSQLEPDSAFYNISAALRLVGQLDRLALQRAIGGIIKRHEVLRTIFVQKEGQPRQVIAHEIDFTVPLIDLNGASAERKTSEIRRRAEQEAEKPFDLSEGPLIRATLLYLGQRGIGCEEEHVLLFTVHHIVFDGWSIGLFVHEFTTLYGVLCAGCSSPLTKLPVQYADFAMWQRQRMQGELLEKHLVYWRRQLEGTSPKLELPTDRPRPATPSYRGGTYSFQIPQEITEGLNTLSREEGTTLFMTLMAVFKMLLSRYSQQEVICVGTPVANRLRPEIESLIGFFINTLALRTNLSGNPSFNELLARERQVCLGAQAHQDLPFEKLVEVLQPERHTSHSPLFQVMFVMQNAPSRKLEVPGLRVSELPMESYSAKFDLTLQVIESEQGLNASFEYSTDLFMNRTIVRMAGHWQRLLESTVADPQARLSELHMLTEAEQRQLTTWNATDVEISQEGRLHSLFETQAARIPDALAVIHAGQSLSYGTLNQLANQLAHALLKKGVGPEVRVGLCLEPGLEMVIGLLGILKAGGAYVPIDPGYPQQRQTNILTDSSATLLVTQQRQVAALSRLGVELLCLDRQQLTRLPGHNLSAVCHPNNAAYLIYTSGSTGQPKGVVVSHRNAVQSTTARFGYYREPVRDFLLLSSYAFDSSVAGIFWTLGQGGRLCIPSEEDRRDPVVLSRLIAREKPSHLLCLPSLYGLLLEQAESGQLASLRVAIVAGEACPAQIVTNHFLRLPAVRLFNEYGPTEGTVWSSVYEVPSADAESGKPIPIGRPINNTRIHLLDGHLNLVPVGVTGELHISGAGITRGYHGQAQLTAERFVPDPFAADAGNRMYNTGDLARYREDGEIEFLGRADHQVKIRGYRIELGEIEVRLVIRPDVKEAAVLVREDHPGDKRLTAYLVLHDCVDTTPDIGSVTESVRSALKAALPEHMIPTAYVVLEVLPKLPNGKVDRKALPTPERSDSQAAQFVAPRNATEVRLAELWRGVLGMEPIGLHDHFFDVGGHSMLAVQLMFRVRETFGVEIPLRLLFEQPTLEAQARLLDDDPLSVTRQIVLPMSWAAEAELDSDITPGRAAMPVAARAASVLLTGATGFLGAFLLRDLVRETDADIYCLVRTDPTQDPATRLRQALERYELTDTAMNPRIIPLPGNLSQPLLGLSADRFERLGGEIDAIYHNGAAVDFTASYETHKPSNVLGTREVLRFACRGKAKAVHYVSTVSIFGEHSPSEPTGFTEEDFPPGNEKLTGGYAQSKWVAEAMVRIAAERGLPVTIHRPSNIFGDSRTGMWNTGDFYCRMIKGCVELGQAPDIDAPLNLVPVDFVSKAIVFLSGRSDLLGKTFHLTASKPIHLNILIDVIREFGYPIQRVPVDQWVYDVTAKVTAQPDHVLYPLLPLFEEWQGNNGTLGDAVNRYNCSRTVNTLRTGNIDHPRAEKVIRVVLATLIKSSSIPRPEKPDRTKADVLK